MFTQYKFSPAQVSEAALAMARACAQAKPGVNPAQFAADVIAKRLRARPETYLQYGPYWWAVKAALFNLGEEFGPADDAGIRVEYGARLPAYGAMVAGEQFREHYLATFLAGTSQFWLDEDGEESYVLFDPDMEARRLGCNALAVSANLAATVEEGGDEDTVLDSAEIHATSERDQARANASLTPFAVDFEFEGALWTATIYAMDFAHAEAKLRALQASGRIGGAIDVVKGIGEPALDGIDYESPLYVDLGRRQVMELENTDAGAVAP